MDVAFDLESSGSLLTNSLKQKSSNFQWQKPEKLYLKSLNFIRLHFQMKNWEIFNRKICEL